MTELTFDRVQLYPDRERYFIVRIDGREVGRMFKEPGRSETWHPNDPLQEYFGPGAADGICLALSAQAALRRLHSQKEKRESVIHLFGYTHPERDLNFMAVCGEEVENSDYATEARDATCEECRLFHERHSPPVRMELGGE